jgi:DNA repair exonuclease SbcCD ATPase subunit
LQVNIATNNNVIQAKKDRIRDIEKEIYSLNNHKSNSEKEQNELNRLKGVLEELQGELKELLENRGYYEAASTLLRDTGVKTKIIKQYLPIINQLTNKYLSSLDFFVNFNLDESFKETIKSRHRDDFSYSSFSEGEKQRIDMALMLTWRAVAKIKNSANTNLLILDETFDSSLDANGTEDLMKILQLLEDVNLFVISHKGDVLQDKFINVIKFKKERNFSKAYV